MPDMMAQLLHKMDNNVYKDQADEGRTSGATNLDPTPINTLRTVLVSAARPTQPTFFHKEEEVPETESQNSLIDDIGACHEEYLDLLEEIQHDMSLTNFRNMNKSRNSLRPEPKHKAFKEICSKLWGR
ncbi:hypothetical protein SUGI_1060240 [Cryptomeria japonica]|nr:hypothetical protein SUGI_1060240 [Cryptomeria japonica]